MSQHLHLAHERILTIPNSDLSAEAIGNQVTFTYRGLSNDPVDDQFLLFQTDFDFERRATLLGDGFQMLAQTTGTYEDPVDIGRCPDNSSSYRLYASKAPKRYYNYLVVEDSLGYALFGFTSCHRFAGYFTVSDENGRVKINAYIDGEQTAPQDWSTNRLESVVVLRGESLRS